MVNRSRSKNIKYNIDKIYRLYNNQRDSDIINEINKMTNHFTNQQITRDFIKKLLIVTKEFEYFSDAFYSYKPFLSALY